MNAEAGRQQDEGGNEDDDAPAQGFFSFATDV